jgi:vanillate O-demethylase monooxygenase subunit
MFAYDCWYVAAFDHELSRAPIGRRILDQPIVMWRLEDGTPVALEDRCCHRGLPLSLGDAIGDQLRCNYHGLMFAPDGRCVSVPGQDSVPSAARVRAYPLAQRGPAVWIWMGDAAKADEALIPPYPWHVDPGWRWKSHLFHFDCNYELLHDNLIDLSHLAYVHRFTVGGGNPDLHFKTETKVVRNERSLSLIRWMPDSDPPATYTKVVPFEGKVDRWQETDYFPGLFSISIGAIPVGQGGLEGPRVGGYQMRIFDAVTPETETTTHNFYSAGHCFRIDEPQVTDTLFAELTRTVEEDIVVLNAQQARAPEGSGKFVDIRIDGPGIQVRRILEQMRAQA